MVSLLLLAIEKDNENKVVTGSDGRLRLGRQLISRKGKVALYSRSDFTRSVEHKQLLIKDKDIIQQTWLSPNNCFYMRGHSRVPGIA